MEAQQQENEPEPSEQDVVKVAFAITVLRLKETHGNAIDAIDSYIDTVTSQVTDQYEWQV